MRRKGSGENGERRRGEERKRGVAFIDFKYQRIMYIMISFLLLALPTTYPYPLLPTPVTTQVRTVQT